MSEKIQKPLVEILKLEVDQYLYWYKGQLFDEVLPPFKDATYSSRIYHTLYSGDNKIAEVTEYAMIDIEPIPSPKELRNRMNAIIDEIPDDELLSEYRWFVETF